MQLQGIWLLCFVLGRYIWFLAKGWPFTFPFSSETKRSTDICKVTRAKLLHSLSGRLSEVSWNLTGCESSSSPLSRAPGASAAAAHRAATPGCPGDFCSFNTPLPMTSYARPLLWSYCLWRPTFGKGGLVWKKKNHPNPNTTPFQKIESVSSSIHV